MRIYAIVSLYNPSRDNIVNIDKTAELFEKMIIIDDSEKNHTFSFFKNNNITAFWNGENVGLTKTINRGLEEAQANGADWVVILDQDGRFNKHILEVYLNYIKDNDISSVALLCPQLNYDRHRRNEKDGYKEVSFCDLSGAMINMNAYKNLGRFDERFFIDGLDTEWCLRARLNGYKIVMCKEALLDHHPAITKSVRLFGIVIFRYGWDTHIRYYYQFKAFMLVHHLYHNARYNLMFIYKIFKIIFLFERKELYFKALGDARHDYMNGFFGKYVG